MADQAAYGRPSRIKSYPDMRVIFNAIMLVFSAAPAFAAAPACAQVPGREAESITGSVVRGKSFERATRGGWILKLVPIENGWFLEIASKGREKEDLSRLTPPWHFVPNSREIEGWHFRNLDNTAPNDGSVNAPQNLREFIFSPRVGKDIEYNGSGTTPEDVEQVRAFGRGWLFIKDFKLTPTKKGERASFEKIKFSACLTWPTG